MVKRIAILIGLIAFGLIIFSPAPLDANAQPLVHPDPLSTGLRAGEQGKISIRVDDVQNMYGIEIHVAFDPNIVQVVDMDSAKPGAQIQAGDWLKNTFVAANKVDNQAGSIDYAVTLLNPAPAVSGGGTVATITFQAKSNGNSPIKIRRAILATRDGKEIKSAWQDGVIGVSPLAVAPGVNPATRAGDEPTDTAVPGLPMREIVLLGVAGLGVLVFFGALAIGGAALIYFRKR